MVTEESSFVPKGITPRQALELAWQGDALAMIDDDSHAESNR